MNTGNRVLWTIIGAILLAAGALGAVANLGHLSGIDRHSVLLTHRMRDWWDDAGNWAPGITIAIGVILVILGILLLGAQLRGGRGTPMRGLVIPAAPRPGADEQPAPPPADLTAPDEIAARPGPLAGGQPDDSGRSAVATVAPSAPERPVAAGQTRVDGSTLRRALTRDLRANRQVNHVAVRLAGAADHPAVTLRLTVTPDADVTRLHDHVDGALRRFAATSGVRPELTDVTVRVAHREPQRVR